MHGSIRHFGIVEVLLNRKPEGTDTGTAAGRGGTGTANRPEHKRGRLFYRHFVEPLVTSHNPPWFDARGVAVGLAVGFGMPIGTQVITLVLLRILFRFNSVLAFAFTWVANPFSLVPMYYGYYKLGSFLLARSSSMTSEAFYQMIAPLMNGGYFWDTMQSFAGLGWQFLTAWTVGAAVITVPSAVIGYMAAFRAQKARCRRRAERMGISYKKLIESMEKTMGKDADFSKGQAEGKPLDGLPTGL